MATNRFSEASGQMRLETSRTNPWHRLLGVEETASDLDDPCVIGDPVSRLDDSRVAGNDAPARRPRRAYRERSLEGVIP